MFLYNNIVSGQLALLLLINDDDDDDQLFRHATVRMYMCAKCCIIPVRLAGNVHGHGCETVVFGLVSGQQL